MTDLTVPSNDPELAEVCALYDPERHSPDGILATLNEAQQHVEPGDREDTEVVVKIVGPTE